MSEHFIYMYVYVYLYIDLFLCGLSLACFFLFHFVFCDSLLTFHLSSSSAPSLVDNFNLFCL